MLPDVRSTLPHNWLWQKWLAVYMALFRSHGWFANQQAFHSKDLGRSHVERRTAELHHSLHEEQPQFPRLRGWPQRTEPWGNEGYRASDRPRDGGVDFFRPEIFGSGNGHHQKKERTSLFFPDVLYSYQFIGIYIYIFVRLMRWEWKMKYIYI